MIVVEALPRKGTTSISTPPSQPPTGISMRELERKQSSTHSACDLVALTIVGRGRLGTALATGLRQAGLTVTGPLGRDAGLTVTGPLGRDPDLAAPQVILLCVPDGEIASAAARLPPGPIVGHCSGAT